MADEARFQSTSPGFHDEVTRPTFGQVKYKAMLVFYNTCLVYCILIVFFLDG